MNETLSNLLLVVVALMGASLIVALLGLAVLAQRIRRMRIPPDADFFTTLRLVPLALVILLDLLDFGLDIFSMPIVWIVLDRMGLPNLRNKAAIEALIPFTGPIPTFTLCWIVARALDLGAPVRQYWPDERYTQRRPREHRLPSRRTTIIDLDDDR